MEKIRIRNFKCFNDIEVDLNKLTVLTGNNGAGKSTVLQALLFLRTTVEHCGSWDKKKLIFTFTEPNGLNVDLNSSYCLSLGDSGMIIPQDSDQTQVEIAIIEKEHIFNVNFDTTEGDLFLRPFESNCTKKDFSIFKQQFYYLNAERLGPRVSQKIKFFDYPNTGYKGEYVAQLLGDTNFSYRFKLDDNRKREGVSPNLIQQTNAWLDFILPGISIDASYHVDTLSAQIKIENRKHTTTAPNIGFGISYVLPIIITGLIAAKNTYMVVENPEAHLHPSAQSKMGEFLAIIANVGVKVIIETHSDHIVNGIQIATLKNKIASKDVTVNFFNPTKEGQPDVKNIHLTEKGELTDWPEGFFDQSQRDYVQLLKLRKNG